ncbi:aminotransferase class IV [Flavicella sp.]|uniref:aminotransferase class IV n=1 Tax=Flavicella sp. TaxID=2957742 RepID=UPI003018F5E9
MINYNGALIEKESFQLSKNNRGFSYGDSLFETIRIEEGEICFLEDHYFRLMASMRMIRMEIPMHLTFEYLENHILNLIKLIGVSEVSKVKITVYRKEGGLYTPDTNEVEFLIETFDTKSEVKANYEIDIYKDHYVNSGLLSTLKSSNRLLNVVASIYAKENDLDACVLINEDKKVVESTNANIFLIKGNIIRTPKLLDGCIKGIARKKIIEILEKNISFEIIEESISPFDIQKADEVFLSNAIVGVQPVTKYRKKNFKTSLGERVSKAFKALPKK